MKRTILETLFWSEKVNDSPITNLMSFRKKLCGSSSSSQYQCIFYNKKLKYSTLICSFFLMFVIPLCT